MTSEPLSIVPAALSATGIQPGKHLTPAEWQEAQEIASSLDVRNAMAITGFGVRPQKEMSDLADPILKMVATKDAGAAGEVLSELVQQVSALDTDVLTTLVEPAVARLPGIGPLFSKVQQFKARSEKVSAKIERIVVELERAKFVLSRDVALLDKFYEQNQSLLRGLLVYTAAGESKLESLRAEQAALAAAAESSQDPLQAQAAADLGNAIDRLERRVHDLKLTTMLALQTAPQIRLVQNGNQALVEKLQSSIVTTIPLWKYQIIMAMALFDQKRMADIQGRVTETTRKMIESNARELRKGVRNVAQVIETGIVEIDTLRVANNELIGTIEDVLLIQEEGRHRRQEAEGQLTELQAQIREVLLRVRDAR